MDNQAMKVIKVCLKPKDVSLQLVGPHNHHINTTVRTIQTFKNRFIGALGTTDVDFSVQLRDKLTSQVQDSINLLCRSRIKPNISVYKALEGPYDWNQYPMAPLSTKEIIYKDSDTWAFLAPHSLNAWILGPSKDHYQCHLFYVPETRGYRVSGGSADLFPQDCMAPKYTPKLHVKELSKELQSNLKKLACKGRNIDMMKTLARHLVAYIADTLIPAPKQGMEQRVEVVPTQRVSDNAHPPAHSDIQRVSYFSITHLANDPTSTRVLQTKLRTHQCLTRHNMPNALPKITYTHVIPPLPVACIPSVCTP
jgi:hypothetical protein